MNWYTYSTCMWSKPPFHIHVLVSSYNINFVHVHACALMVCLTCHFISRLVSAPAMADVVTPLGESPGRSSIVTTSFTSLEVSSPLMYDALTRTTYLVKGVKSSMTIRDTAFAFLRDTLQPSVSADEASLISMEKLCMRLRLLVILQMTWTLFGEGELSSVIIGDTGLAVGVVKWNTCNFHTLIYRG